eukprot:15349011-Ditylum_brightwellii.AAC.1
METDKSKNGKRNGRSSDAAAAAAAAEKVKFGKKVGQTKTRMKDINTYRQIATFHDNGYNNHNNRNKKWWKDGEWWQSSIDDYFAPPRRQNEPESMWHNHMDFSIEEKG